ncbi:hypothetical protein [Candidatus Vidania fulgoroideorum]
MKIEVIFSKKSVDNYNKFIELVIKTNKFVNKNKMKKFFFQKFKKKILRINSLNIKNKKKFYIKFYD